MDHFCGPPLDVLQKVHVSPVPKTPHTNTELQARPHQYRAENQDHLPHPAGHTSFDPAQDVIGLLGCKHMLLAHVQLFDHQNSQVLLQRAALSEFFFQSVPISKIALTHMQYLVLGLLNLI